jgi:hypothetical protein
VTGLQPCAVDELVHLLEHRAAVARCPGEGLHGGRRGQEHQQAADAGLGTAVHAGVAGFRLLVLIATLAAVAAQVAAILATVAAVLAQVCAIGCAVALVLVQVVPVGGQVRAVALQLGAIARGGFLVAREAITTQLAAVVADVPAVLRGIDAVVAYVAAVVADVASVLVDVARVLPYIRAVRGAVGRGLRVGVGDRQRGGGDDEREAEVEQAA